ncbi:membrane hypothetical protein [Candidatus Accumulibacter aalborgensis]|uniref:Polysaccharide biosynthesis protein n=1 Tax=Candidatus Accumulibacter aalborgensis TaxID=1860102 RepID=A0A1A8XUV2_9PROT|nr:membrane hypothetical protein [Candidatus Accumulibacter aalborgensis]
MGLRARLLPLLGGNVFAQLLQIAAIPLLTRFYGPERYGEYGLFAASLLFSSMVATLRYELAIQLPKSDSLASCIAALCLAIASMLSLVVFGLAFVLLPRISNIVDVGQFSILLAASTLFLGVHNILNALSLRFGQYRINGLVKIVQVGVGSGSALLLYWEGNNRFGLMYGNVLGYLMASLLLLLRLRKRLLFTSVGGDTLRAIRVVAKRYSSFAIFNAPQALLDGMRPMLVVSFIQNTYGGSAAGFYHIANQLLQTPASVVTQAFSQVHFRYLVESIGTSGIRPLMRRHLLLLSSVAFVGVLATFLTAAPLTTLLFGSKWIGLDQTLTALIVLVAVNLIVAPLVFVFHAKRKHREFFAWGSIYNLMAIASIWFGCSYFSEVNNALRFYAFVSSSILLAIGVHSVKLSLEQKY